ncbi:MAG TPA: PilZ domain-containing protein [Candidatus Omnitrophota bacterium]|nr:PilZ domain-containing protein [Candidatus Omnitrophota bacterium]HPT07017.1 PilZ domain-containing protein [Candidatus Omnitrophota bacterium]
MVPPYRESERRKFKRLAVNFIVIYRVHQPFEVIMIVGTREVSAMMIDLSQGGMALMTEYDIPPDARLLLCFTLINPYGVTADRVATMELEGDVRYNVALGKKEHRLGICFRDVSQSDQHAIASFIRLSHQ